MRARGTDRHQYRVTLDPGTGEERVLRAADESRLSLSEGDVVRARVGPRMRWIFDVHVVGDDRA